MPSLYFILGLLDWIFLKIKSYAINSKERQIKRLIIHIAGKRFYISQLCDMDDDDDHDDRDDDDEVLLLYFCVLY